MRSWWLLSWLLAAGCGPDDPAADRDGDGFPRSEDCDDDARGVWPGHVESCDGVDQDCDGLVDEDAVGAPTWYADSDHDGYGDRSRATVACVAPDEGARDGRDCDDADPGVNPVALESCNGADDDCDGRVDSDDGDVVDEATWYLDDDGDGYGREDRAISRCDPPDGHVAESGDCDDGDPAVSPAAAEVCDAARIDEDCDGEINEQTAADPIEWYADADGDGWGDGTVTASACDRPDGYVADAGDCAPDDATVSPSALETCDGLDDDCDGVIDESDATDAPTWYVDADGDGWGADATAARACVAPSGWIAVGGDCDDTSAARWPGADERCDGADDDCDGTADEGAVDAATWYADADGDGYGNPSRSTVSCTAGSGRVSDATDCDDTDASTNPGADEVCGGGDDDCDGNADEDAVDATAWYPDGDGDGYGDAASSTVACTAPRRTVADDTDCDDADVAIHPGATEVCDARDTDEDCDGLADDADTSPSGTRLWYADADGDGFGDASDPGVALCDDTALVVATATDCDDADATVSPDGVESCNGVDDDCDGVVDPDTSIDASEWHPDRDADGYGAAIVTADACTAPSGWIADADDCDDLSAARYPGADEVCDGSDDDCDFVVDEDDAVDALTWYADSDSDGHGDATVTDSACTAPSGYVATDDDCDDTDASAYPGATEVCDDADTDEDCDGPADDADASVTGLLTFYLDGDADGYGGFTTLLACDAPSASYASDGGDCDDTDGTIHPDAEETCGDGVDENCDGTADGCTLSGEYALENADLVMEGATANDYVGARVAGGDVDDDGYADLLVTAYGYDRASSALNAGRAWLWYGPLDSAETLASSDAKLTGDGGGDRMGWSVELLTDADGTRIALGADGYDGTTSGDCGAVYVFEGTFSGSISATSADATISGAAAGDYAGYDLGTADLNDDGTADLLVGAYGDDTVGSYSGAVTAWFSPLSGDLSWADDANATFTGANTGDAAGYALAGADIDGNGYGDVVIGAYAEDTGGSSAGAVYLFAEFTIGSQSVSDADTVLTGAAAGDELGHAVECVGDLDGDGLDDLALGARYHDGTSTSNAGAAWIVYGSSSTIASGVVTAVAGATIDGAATGDRAGDAFAGGGDVDGDGARDLLLGAERADSATYADAGAVYLLYGPFSGTIDLGAADAWFTGPSASAYAGGAMAILGDTDADGYDDIGVGVQGYDVGGSYSVGAAYLWLGRGD